MKYKNVFELIMLALWGKGNPKVDWSVYHEMKSQAIAALPASVLPSLELTSELMREWRKTIYQQIAYFTNYLYVQSHLPIDVPYVILKGTSAAQYYPHPEYRTMGDIDIITRQEDYDSCCEMMLRNAWCDNTSENDLKRGRHRSFVKNGIIVEVHTFFASMNDVKKAKAFDDIIFGNITENHILPDLINGLVLIEHINQHMEQGIGLRQIIDWMMFVDKCLTDDQWNEFEIMATKTGLKELAVTTTRMCEIFLGLPIHRWCMGVDEKLSRNLMEYIMQSGNFGIKLNPIDTLYVSRVYQLRHPFALVRELQRKGHESAKIERCPILRPLAWTIEGWRRFCKTPDALGKIRNARRMNTLFKSLGISRSTERLVFFKDGLYYKKNNK